MRRKTLPGLLGVLGIWITAGFALPFVNVLNMFTPPQLMALRGSLTAGMAIIGLRGRVGHVDKYTYLIALTVPFVTLGLFEGIRHWGAGPTLTIFAATPLVNLLISALLRQRISPKSIVGLVLVLGGVVIARWGGHFQWAGFIWALFGTIMNGILYEFFARAKTTWLQKNFYAYIGMGVLGLVLSTGESWSAIADLKNILLALVFASIGGFLYGIANIVTFENLPTTEASVLAQGETPAVIIGAYIMSGERLTLIQWIGVGITLCGAWHLSRQLPKQPAQKQ